MSAGYTENDIQESAGKLLHDELGWQVVFAYNKEVLGEKGTLGRKSYEEVVLWRYFRKALRRLNPWINDEQTAQAQRIFSDHLASASLMQTNEEKYRLIRDGIPVAARRRDGGTENKTAIVIDFANPENNDFLAVKEMKIHSRNYHRRTDIVGFVNGIPLLFVELKNYYVDVKNAYTDNYTDYLDTVQRNRSKSRNDWQQV